MQPAAGHEPPEGLLSSRLDAARERARNLLAQSAMLLVAARATVDESSRLLAHALPDIGEVTATKGVTLCKLLAEEEVGLVPDLRWEDVLEEYRCPDCVEVAAAATS